MGSHFGPRRSCSWSVVVSVDVADADTAVSDEFDVAVDVVVAVVAAFAAGVCVVDDVLFLLLFLEDDVSASGCRSPSSLASSVYGCQKSASLVLVRCLCLVLRQFHLILLLYFCDGLQLLFHYCCL